MQIVKDDEKDKLKLHHQDLETESIHSQSNSVHKGLSQPRCLNDKKYPHLNCLHIATSHDGKFVATFNSGKENFLKKKSIILLIFFP